MRKANPLAVDTTQNHLPLLSQFGLFLTDHRRTLRTRSARVNCGHPRPSLSSTTHVSSCSIKSLGNRNCVGTKIGGARGFFAINTYYDGTWSRCQSLGNYTAYAKRVHINSRCIDTGIDDAKMSLIPSIHWGGGLMDEPKTAIEAAREVMGRLVSKIQSRANEAGFRRRVAEYEADVAARQKREHAELCIDRGIPLAGSLIEIATQRNPPATMAINRIRDALMWRQSQEGRHPLILVLSGPPGAGKTTAIAWATGQHKHSALYTYARAIASTPDSGWSENQEKWYRWAGVDLLSIDEIGIDSGGVGTELIGSLISRRYDFGGATLCATNCDWETFKVNYADDRLMNRLEHGPNPWVDLGDCDLRNPANKLEIVEGVR